MSIQLPSAVDRWLGHHLETFVKPHLGGIPSIDDPKKVRWFHEPSLKKVSAIVACWERAKQLAGSKPILLPGRDVYLFNVLAEIEGFPVIFRPEISSPVAREANHLFQESFERYYGVDTGFRGSVLKALGMTKFGLVWLEDKQHKSHWQLFPYAQGNTVVCGASRGFFRELVAFLEGHNKYWTRAQVAYEVRAPKKGDPLRGVVAGIEQYLSDPDEFTKSAQFIIRFCGLLNQLGYPRPRRSS